MGLVSRIGNFFSRVGRWFLKSVGERRIVSMFHGWGGAVPHAWSSNRFELVNHFRGWNFIAIKAICEEVACLTPSICEILEGDGVEDEYQKRIRECKSLGERREFRTRFNRKFLRGQRRTKALANVQESDELKPVSTTHPLVKLLRNPNEPDVAWSFFYKLQLYLELTGVSYIWIVPDRMGRPAELWVLPSHWVFEIPGKDTLIDSYEVRPSTGLVANTSGPAWWNGGGAGRFALPADQVIKIAYPHPGSFTDGYSPIQAIGTWVDVSENIDTSRVKAFHNGMFPGVVIELDKELADPDPEELLRIQAKVKEKYGGVKNTGEPAILAPGMKLVPLSTRPVDMEYVSSGDQVKSWILAAHRTGQSVVGLAENTTFASMVASRANFYGGTIKPKLVFTGQILTEKLAKRYSENLVVFWEDPTPDDPDMKLRKWETLSRLSACTPNEIRADYGMEPFEHGGDDPMGSPGSQPLGWATGEDPMQDQMDAMGQGGMPGQGMPGQEPGQGDMTLQDAMGGDGASEDDGGATLEDIIGQKRMNGVTNGKH